MTNETQTAILAEMRELLSSREKWTKRTSARTKDGSRIHVEASSAFCFCLVGAFSLARYRVTGVFYTERVDSWLYDRHRERFPLWEGSIVDWNDLPTTTFTDILAFLKE